MAATVRAFSSYRETMRQCTMLGFIVVTSSVIDEDTSQT